MTVVQIGDREPSRDAALAFLRSFAMTHAGTVYVYDLAGDRDGTPGPGGAAEPVNKVTLADIGRLVVIKAGLEADDVPRLLDVQAEAELKAVPPTARLEDCSPGSDLCEAATSLYDLFKPPKNIGPVKRSKLLHIKRPWLFPIYDTHVHRVYKDRVKDLQAQIGDADVGWWEAARRDLVDGTDDFRWLSSRLRDDDDARVRRAGKLTQLRMLDIIAWNLGADTA